MPRTTQQIISFSLWLNVSCSFSLSSSAPMCIKSTNFLFKVSMSSYNPTVSSYPFSKLLSVIEQSNDTHLITVWGYVALNSSTLNHPPNPGFTINTSGRCPCIQLCSPSIEVISTGWTGISGNRFKTDISPLRTMTEVSATATCIGSVRFILPPFLTEERRVQTNNPPHGNVMPNPARS